MDLGSMQPIDEGDRKIISLILADYCHKSHAAATSIALLDSLCREIKRGLI